MTAEFSECASTTWESWVNVKLSREGGKISKKHKVLEDQRRGQSWE